MGTTIVGDYFQTTPLEREGIINRIVATVPKGRQDTMREALETIAEQFCGVDRTALSVLRVAADDGKLPEYLKTLDAYHRNLLHNIPPEQRANHATAEFFASCYRRLGIPFSDN